MATSNPIAWRSIGLWALKILIALVFILFGTMKLLSAPMLVESFKLIGLGQGFRVFTGLVEIGGAILLLVPRTSPVGAGVLLGVSLGAFVAQLTRLHEDVVHTLVLAGLAGFLLWAGRSRLGILRHRTTR